MYKPNCHRAYPYPSVTEMNGDRYVGSRSGLTSVRMMIRRYSGERATRIANPIILQNRL